MTHPAHHTHAGPEGRHEPATRAMAAERHAALPDRLRDR